MAERGKTVMKMEKSLGHYFSEQKVCHRHIQEIMKLNGISDSLSQIVFAEVTHEEQLAELYGSPKAKDLTEKNGMSAGAGFGFLNVGFNAVAEGISERRTFISKGREITYLSGFSPCFCAAIK